MPQSIRPCLAEGGFDNILVSASFYDAFERKTCRSQQSGKFRRRPLDATRYRQHQQIHHFAMVGRIAFRKHGLDDEQTSGWRHGSSTIAKNRERVVVGPIVQDMCEDVTIVSFRNCAKEVSFGNGATAGQSLLQYRLARCFRRFRQVEKNAAEASRCLQDCLEQRPRAAADIYNRKRPDLPDVRRGTRRDQVRRI